MAGINADYAANTESLRIQRNALEKSILTTKWSGMLVRKRRVAWTAASQPPDTPTPSWEGMKPSIKTARAYIIIIIIIIIILNSVNLLIMKRYQVIGAASAPSLLSVVVTFSLWLYKDEYKLVSK